MPRSDMTTKTTRTTRGSTPPPPSTRSVRRRAASRNVRVRDRVHRVRPVRQQKPSREVGGSTNAEMRQLLVTIGSELAVITGLLYYFGWVRTRVQAESLGFASSVLNLSITDYMLKSVNVLFPLLIALLLLTILGHFTFVGILRRWPVDGSGHVSRSSRAAKVLAFSCVLGAVLSSLPPASNRFFLPMGLTAAVLFALAARALESRVTGHDPWTRPRRWMVTLLLIFLIFWDTERVALFFGEQFAADYKARPDQFSAITIYSKDDLRLDAEGVETESLGDDQDSYRYRYTGLRLMESVADRYILINEVWANGHGRVFVIVQSDAIRVEFIGHG